MTERQSRSASAVMVASDLDRTLIYSLRSAELPPGSPVRLRLVERDGEGAPLSHLTERAAQLLAELAREAVFVPATTRTVEQYRRIRLPGPAGAGGFGPAGGGDGADWRPPYAICANGGRLLVAGEPDQDWAAVVAQRLAAHAAPLPEVAERLAGRGAAGGAGCGGSGGGGGAEGGWLLRQRVAEGLFVYAIVDRERLPAAWLDELTAWCAERGWTVSLQGRKLYAVPRVLTKSAAVAEVVRRQGGRATVLAAGDSLLDADLLLAADHAWRPGHGELAERGWTGPRVTALEQRGALAGEQILSALLTRVRQLNGQATDG
ncbi:HAD family hydrolase [Kitasatospora sp. NBC_01302]|uniref:HAD family hydrolase n=1 Tax=Kitasatospora sp. NBC_01302 TaxID=2903575 RepID=UPI002E0F6962|nr:HAD family hydrolase [Kitasatospora sp. NBC_01302]